MSRWVLIIIVLTTAFAVACSSKPSGNNANSPTATANANTDTQNGARTKVEDLSLLINMPYDVQDVVWKQSKDQKKITAVIHFDPDDEKKVIPEAEKFGPAQNVTVETQSWFPDDLTAQSDLHGDEPLAGKRTQRINSFRTHITQAASSTSTAPITTSSSCPPNDDASLLKAQQLC